MQLFTLHYLLGRHTKQFGRLTTATYLAGLLLPTGVFGDELHPLEGLHHLGAVLGASVVCGAPTW